MEEDIKILEEFNKNGYSMLLMKYGDRNKANLKLERAIENILKRYKELEEEKPNEEEKEVLQAYRNYKKISGSNSWVICNPSTMWSELFIPTSVIQNKIEEVNNSNGYSPVNKIFIEKVLNEILEEGSDT